MSLVRPPAEAAGDPPGCRLIVLAKEPVPGRVKTRLSPHFSPAQAAELAAAALADTLAAVIAAATQARTSGHVVEPVLVLEGSAGRWLDELLDGPSRLPVIRQRPGGLAARIAGAFEDATRGGPASAAVLVGMDTPQVTGRLLADAVDALANPGCDAVLGLADDGGWWALGLRRPDETLLRGVPMSTSGTGRAQLARLVSAGLAVTLLPQLRDVDLPGDALAVAALAPGGRFAATVRRLQPATSTNR